MPNGTTDWPPHIGALYVEDTTQIRFMKRQQWAITNYSLALQAAIFGVDQAIKGTTGFAEFSLLVAVVGAAFWAPVLITMIQKDILCARKRLAGIQSRYLGITSNSIRRDGAYYWTFILVCLLAGAIVFTTLAMTGPASTTA